MPFKVGKNKSIKLFQYMGLWKQETPLNTEFKCDIH